ncbi:hypothetical protein MTR_7g406920 [Medicago truncatula]|uniref:Uncharacterized protein n=1 Tax=Medicago truncatula TaxID=3880 RepID=A0A072TWD5_MEDTR|nr:hypothetical protein MTR_7g406920 [Medicago truncatula]
MVAFKHGQYIQATKVDKPESIQIIEHTSDKIAEISTTIFYRHGRTKMINSNIYTCGEIAAFEVFVTKIYEKKRKTKREREDKHQEAAPTSQLGWHSGEPPSYAAKLKLLLKKKGKKYTRGGTRPIPSKKKTRKKKKKETRSNGLRESVIG